MITIYIFNIELYSVLYERRLIQFNFIMGVILNCECKHCDYFKYGILFGWGMSGDYFLFPARNSGSRSVLSIDLLQYPEYIDAYQLDISRIENLKMKKMRHSPYFLEKMHNRNFPGYEILSEEPYLQSQGNFCPECEKYELEFRFAGFFD